MSVVIYPALVTPNDHGLQGRFPDFPALTFAAAATEELVRVAREALSGELQRLGTEDNAWPPATPFQDLAVPAGSSAVLVDVSVDDTPVRLTISLGERLLKRIDQDAEARSMTRSGYLALGARGLLGDAATPGARPATDAEAGRKLREEIAELARRVNETLGPTSPIGRSLAELDAIALEGLRRLGAEVRGALSSKRAPTPGRPQEGGATSEGFEPPGDAI